MVGAMKRVRQAVLAAFLATLPLAAQAATEDDPVLVITDPAPPEAAPDPWHSTRHAECLTLAAEDPQKGVESALQWEAEGGGALARHCQAQALIGLGLYQDAGDLLEQLARASDPEDRDAQAALFAEAGHVWILAGALPRALEAFTAALELTPDNAGLRIDRALARALSGDYWGAIDDLNAAEDVTQARADLLILRAAAYRYLEVHDLAAADLEAALLLEPENPEAYLERGNLRLATGDQDGARADWLKVLALEPEGPAAEAARWALERLDVKAEE